MHVRSLTPTAKPSRNWWLAAARWWRCFGILGGALEFKPEIAADFNEAMRQRRVLWQLTPAPALVQ